MSDAHTATGATIGCVAVTAIPADKSAYEGLTYAEIGEVATIGPLGDSHERITVTALKDGRTISIPGAVDGGELAIAINTEHSSDAGQTAIRTANGTSGLVAFQITDPGGTVKKYFVGRVANYMESDRSPSVNQGATFTIWRATAITT